MIKFTEHVEFRLEERGITKKQIIECLENPDVTLPTKANRQITIKKFETLFLKTVFVKENSDIIVITTHWISKVKLRNKL